METPSDAELIKQFSEGHTPHPPFTKLVQKYREPIYWTVRRWVKSHEAADDVVQNTWIKVWNHLNSFKGDSAFYTWLYRIAKNEAFTYLNTAYERKFVPTDDPWVESAQTQGPSGEEIERLLLEAVDQLPEKQQLVFQMKYFDDMKFREISEILGTSEGALKASYHHAVKKIEAILENALNH